MSKIESYKDLIAWQKSFDLGLSIYNATKTFPDNERFGLTSQLRRGAIAVPSNIAEGYGRESRSDYVRFLKIARGALYEQETQLLFAHQLNYLAAETFERLRQALDECSRVLGGLIRSLDS